jgi:hypothetical protein
MAKAWNVRILTEAHGNKSQGGALIIAALRNASIRIPRAHAGLPRFNGRAIVTSDGFLICFFVGKDRQGHAGAFAGAANSFEKSCNAIAANARLDAEERRAFFDAIKSFVEIDYRVCPGFRFE